MVGDGVLLFGDKPVKVDCIGNVEVYLSDENGIDWRVTYEHIKPIPLTPEILEKNGFVNDNSVYGVRYRWESEDTRTEIRIYSPQDGYSGMTIIKNSYLVDEVSYDLPDVYMVHELQHALKLCGIEKEIAL